MPGDRPALGILLMLGFCIVIPIADALAKLLGQTLPLAQLILVRFVAQMLLFMPLVWWAGESLRLSPLVWKLTVLRTLLHIAGLGMMFAAFRVLPLADAIAIAFVMPFLLLLFGRLFLNEDVGARRIGACIVGFAGTLLVIRPSFVDVGAAALLPLGVAVVFAGFMLVTRKLTTLCSVTVLQGTSGALATALIGPVMLLAGDLDPELDWIAPTAGEAALLVVFGILGAGSHFLMTLSLRYAPASTLAPLQYVEIPAATLVGWIFFGNLPDGTAPVGIAVTMAAGLYILLREHRLARAVASP